MSEEGRYVPNRHVLIRDGVVGDVKIAAVLDVSLAGWLVIIPH